MSYLNMIARVARNLVVRVLKDLEAQVWRACSGGSEAHVSRVVLPQAGMEH